MKSGDDDHPSYSDSQLSEAMAARVINAIAGNPELWEKSAIIITYDESDGLYDHVPPRILSYGPDGLPLARGIRIPLILISPYARAHAVAHAEGDHNAVIETINALFGLPALSSLPDEAQALADGDFAAFNAFAPKGFEQKFLGPRDTPSPITDSLLSGFDKARVTGALPPLPASLATDPERRRRDLPALRRQGLRGDRGHAGERAAEHPQRDPRGLQFAARDAAGLQLKAAAFAAGLGLALAAAPAPAGPVIDRIKAEGVIRCGGVSRPGLVGQSPDGKAASGLYLDLCRAIGAALLGPDGRIAFRPYDFDKAFDRVRSGADDLSFLDGSEILDQDLAGRTASRAAGRLRLDRGDGSGQLAVRRLADLAGRSICFYQGSNAHRNLEAWMAAHRLDFLRRGFMEYVELYDTYDAGACEAQVGETGDLAVARLAEAAAGLKSRILPEPLATFPVFAVTPTSDPQWSAIVAWGLTALQRAELPPRPWAAGGLGSIAVKGAEVGAPDDWQKRILGAAGTYADIYARNLGEGSRLRLPRGPNAPVEAGGWFVTPYRE